MAGAGFTPIIPKKAPAGSPRGDLERAMKDWSGRVLKKMATYPPQRSATYHRTGTYGRGWRKTFALDGGRLVATVETTVPYASFVGGTGEGGGQVRSAAAAGWPTLYEVAMDEWDPKTLGAINNAFKDSVS